jgi:hypothetical protein
MKVLGAGTVVIGSDMTALDAGTAVIEGGTTVLDAGTVVIEGGTAFTEGDTVVLKGGMAVTEGGMAVTEGGTAVIEGGTVVLERGTAFTEGDMVAPAGGTTVLVGGTVARSRVPRMAEGPPLVQHPPAGSLAGALHRAVDHLLGHGVGGEDGLAGGDAAEGAVVLVAGDVLRGGVHVAEDLAELGEPGDEVGRVVPVGAAGVHEAPWARGAAVGAGRWPGRRGSGSVGITLSTPC